MSEVTASLLKESRKGVSKLRSSLIGHLALKSGMVDMREPSESLGSRHVGRLAAECRTDQARSGVNILSLASHLQLEKIIGEGAYGKARLALLAASAFSQGLPCQAPLHGRREPKSQSSEPPRPPML